MVPQRCFFPRTYDCVITWQRGAKVPNQLTLRRGSYPRLAGHPQGPSKQKRGTEKEGGGRQYERIPAKKEGRAVTQERGWPLEAEKVEETDSPLELPERTTALATL